MTRKRTFAIGALLLGAFGLPAQAQIVDMVSELDGSQEGGGVMTTATGQATVVVDTAANTLSFNLSFSGLTSAQTGAHIHGPAAPGQSAGIAFNIGLGSPVNGVWNYPNGAEAGILAGLYYFNVHTMNFPSGEIRGQITRAPISYCGCDVAAAPCNNPDPQAGCANSLGAGAAISSSGLASVGIDSLRLTANGVPANQNGIFFMGTSAINAPFGDGLRCAGGMVFRFPVHNSGSAAQFVVGPGIVAHSQATFSVGGQIDAGETFFFQCWYRDPGGPCGTNFNLSDAVEVTFTQ